MPFRKLQSIPSEDIDFFLTCDQIAASCGSGMSPPERIVFENCLEAYRATFAAWPCASKPAIDTARKDVEIALTDAGLEVALHDAMAKLHQWQEHDNKRKVAENIHQYPCLSAKTAHQVAPNIFVGNYYNAADQDILCELGVTHVLSCIDVEEKFPTRFEYLTIASDDTPIFDISRQFDRSFWFIERAVRTGGVVYVHCGAGLSRAPTLVAAYLIRKLRIGHIAALTAIERVRPCAHPNQAFRQQLEAFAEFVCMTSGTDPYIRE